MSPRCLSNEKLSSISLKSCQMKYLYMTFSNLYRISQLMSAKLINWKHQNLSFMRINERVLCHFCTSKCPCTGSHCWVIAKAVQHKLQKPIHNLPLNLHQSDKYCPYRCSHVDTKTGFMTSIPDTYQLTSI